TRVAQSARTYLRYRTEAGHVERPVGIAAERCRSHRRLPGDDPAGVGRIGVEVERRVVPCEVRVIERVEGIDAELESHPLLQLELLLHGDIEVYRSRRVQVIDA